MPMDLELVLSANPPLFVGSECRLSVCALQQSNPLFQTCSIKRNYRRASTNVPPIKPCMSPRDEQIQSEPTSPTSSNRIKRRVSFADDKGYSLTQSSGRRLDANLVSLENVIVKSDELITGTIKVKNVTFEKRVFVRATFDGWKTMQDFAAEYVANGHLSNMYDTFCFSIPIPPSASSNLGVIEFCVCFEHDKQEHWDNNKGKNYKLVALSKKAPSPTVVRRFTDALKADVDSWTEFASWKNLASEGPYW
ncbi:hypothetical protein MTO96_021312 [Rhipicephalus appendiculatus]